MELVTMTPIQKTRRTRSRNGVDWPHSSEEHYEEKEESESEDPKHCSELPEITEPDFHIHQHLSLPTPYAFAGRGLYPCSYPDTRAGRFV
jgi:hypothetical protein